MKNIGIVGASGFTGAELLRLLTNHPEINVEVATGETMAGTRICDLYPSLASAYPTMAFRELNLEELKGLDVIFCALPHGLSQKIIPNLIGKSQIIVDLGSDFRLKNPQDYIEWYGLEHSCPEYLKQAVYGLPELFRKNIEEAQLIAATGCNAAASIFALAPMIHSGLIEANGVVINLITGVSGAGRPPKDNTTFCAVDENIVPYGLLTHRHTPEIEQALYEFTGKETSVLFTPHLAPMNRGIIATCYGKLMSETTTEDALDQLATFYKDEPFVVVDERPPSTKSTLGSNTVHLTARVDQRTKTLISIATLDNLVKGASGMAIQNANLALGFNETTGLPITGLYP
ncbi:MAG: N-acetyl-gamma-glutamyl-phosphate reductase [Acidimicrobiales bacterium]|jgi:N-acetyl-gamma-glutamyl-phosphate reductase|nr:N-acetyl-gamma-glutamyl-phosphate reductase [Acidimicrobiales bacterium]MDP6298670.1 N-acetyl-gamma-glutamyl-phosphate reductase [Acidimicrobiales bacterium]HJM28850.1 N-acetyl-gamma-glutamyl-phosphate reductase [Acidimicrobiales bacterium]HJM98154.1 N-acetyl-gamma-glutamyl-phosphate reductase [Acidimicrobiales bacterium]